MSEDNVKRGNAPKSKINRTGKLAGRNHRSGVLAVQDNDDRALNLANKFRNDLLKTVETELEIKLPTGTGSNEVECGTELVSVASCDIAIALAVIIRIVFAMKTKGAS